MPNEFNELVSSMWAYQNQQFVMSNEQYRQLPNPNEVSDPVNFIAYLQDRVAKKEKIKTEPQFRLPTKDELIRKR